MNWLKQKPKNRFSARTILVCLSRVALLLLKGIAIAVLSLLLLPFLLILIIVKVLWAIVATWGHGEPAKEEKELVHRAKYLTSKIEEGPEQLFNKMPSFIGSQFQGEWALYTCSMTSVAWSNIVTLFPKYQENAVKSIERIINVALSPKIREYDKKRWNEDPLENMSGNKSHITYLSHLAWMIGRYKQIGGDNRFDNLYHSLCETMNRRILQSPILNLPSYPGEPIYLPDMLVAIVALHEYARFNNGKYQSTVDRWIQRARLEWIDNKTGLLASRLTKDGEPIQNCKGSYSASNCAYLSLIDPVFAKEQYECLKRNFKQSFPFTGIREDIERKCMYYFDVDAGPVILYLSSSGTAFAIGCATRLGDRKFRKQLLRTAEIAGSTVTWNGKSHYLLADFALVGEAIALAMRTSYQETIKPIYQKQ